MRCVSLNIFWSLALCLCLWVVVGQLKLIISSVCVGGLLDSGLPGQLNLLGCFIAELLIVVFLGLFSWVSQIPQRSNFHSPPGGLQVGQPFGNLDGGKCSVFGIAERTHKVGNVKLKVLFLNSEYWNVLLQLSSFCPRS